MSATGKTALSTPTLLATVLDWSLILSLVFGGCCSNAWSLGRLLHSNPKVGSALSFCQLIFVALRQLPAFVTLSPIPGTSLHLIPVLKPRVIPLRRWIIDVLLIFAVSVLNNRVFGYRIPLTVQIIFRSGGLGVSMLLGHIRLGRKYSVLQIVSVSLVTLGVILATLASAPTNRKQSTSVNTQALAVAPADYALGVVLLLVGLLISGFLGLRQEETFRRYGPQWQESLFYTHLLSLPLWSLFLPDIQSGLSALHSNSIAQTGITFYLPPRTVLGPTYRLPLPFPIPTLYWALALNVVSQYMCVAGVNRLTTRVSSVGVNLILTARKTISVIINVLYLGEGWNEGMVLGAGMVAGGTVLYTLAPTPAPVPESEQLPAPPGDKKKVE